MKKISINQKVKILSNHKLLCCSSEYCLYSNGPFLYVSTGLEEKERYINVIPVGRVRRFIGNNIIMARLLRLQVRCGIFVDEKLALISYKGAIYSVDCSTGEIKQEHRFRAEMNNPLSFTKIFGINGFVDGIYYGDYYLNKHKKDVNIYRRTSDGHWECAYTFLAGTIYHIHAVVPDIHNDCVYVLTGDEDSESGIWRCRNDFSEVEPLIKGSQSYRACIALPTTNGIIYATDTPLEQNYLYFYDSKLKKAEPIMELDGPCIYGRCISEHEMIFSTSVEPDSRIKGIAYNFTYKLGDGVKNRYTHLYYVNTNDNDIKCVDLFQAKKDCLPMGAAQFGTLQFPTGTKECIVVGQSIKRFDNKTIRIIVDESINNRCKL